MVCEIQSYGNHLWQSPIVKQNVFSNEPLHRIYRWAVSYSVPGVVSPFEEDSEFWRPPFLQETIWAMVFVWR